MLNSLFFCSFVVVVFYGWNKKRLSGVCFCLITDITLVRLKWKWKQKKKYQCIHPKKKPSPGNMFLLLCLLFLYKHSKRNQFQHLQLNKNQMNKKKREKCVKYVDLENCNFFMLCLLFCMFEWKNWLFRIKFERGFFVCVEILCLLIWLWKLCLCFSISFVRILFAWLLCI